MPLALWTLLWLNFRAVGRKTGRQLKTVRGIIFFVIALCLFSVWIGPSIFLNIRMPPADRAVSMVVAPAAILLFTALNLFASAGERAVTFTPAEVDFLFPGPFSRRQLLTYKLVKTGIAGLISALFFSVMLGRFGGTFLCRFVGVWLLFQFFQLLAMVIALLQSTVGERLVTSGRRWILVGLVAAVLLAAGAVVREHPALFHTPLSPALLNDAAKTVSGRVVLAPFKVFAHALFARHFLFEGVSWAAVAAVIDLLLAAVVMGLDANFLETSATVSARRYDRLSRVRRSGLGGLAKASSTRWKLAMLPWFGGAGPIIWRQLTTALRTARTLLMVLAVVAVAAGLLISRVTSENGMIGIAVGMSFYLNLFLSQMLKFDFRGDLDHMDVLRSLPLRASAVAVAQLTVPAVMLSAIQLVLLVPIAITGHLPVRYVLGVVCLAVPINFLSLGIDNLMFLLFPFRQKAVVAGDMTMMGRQTIVVVCRFILLFITVGIAGGFGYGVWFLTNRSWIPAGAVAWLILAGATTAIIWLTGLTYDRFDPSNSTPT